MLIDSAPQPQAEPVPEIIRSELRRNSQNSKLTGAVSIAVCLTITVIAVILGNKEWSIAFGITLVILLAMLAVILRNGKISDTAVMYRFPVHHMEKTSESRQYAVLYLPDGKY